MNIFKKIVTLAICMTLSAAMVNAKDAVDSDSNFRIAVGTKLWHTDWTTWDGTGRTAISRTARPAIVPNLSILKDNWVASVGYMQTNGFTLDVEADNPKSTVSAKRSEVDVSVGYRLDALTLSLGYKTIKMNFVAATTKNTGDIEFTYAGPIVGLSFGTEINDWLNAYGSFGFGVLRADNVTKAKVKDPASEYYTTEVGFSTGLSTDISATVGYKFQIIDVTNRSRKTQDITKGFIGGVNWVF